MNPPYGRQIGRWLAKAYRSSRDGPTVVCLVPARKDTAWWDDFAMRGEPRLLRGRLKFVGGKHSAPFPSAVVVFRPPNFSMAALIRELLLVDRWHWDGKTIRAVFDTNTRQAPILGSNQALTKSIVDDPHQTPRVSGLACLKEDLLHNLGLDELQLNAVLLGRFGDFECGDLGDGVIRERAKQKYIIQAADYFWAKGLAVPEQTAHLSVQVQRIVSLFIEFC